MTTSVKGSLNLEVFIGTIDVHAKLYLIKPGTMVASVILGQLWQRQYNAVPRWREEGLKIEIDGARYFTPFYNEETCSQLSHSDVEEIIARNELNEVEEIQKQPPQSKIAGKTQNILKQTWRWVPKKTLTEAAKTAVIKQ